MRDEQKWIIGRNKEHRTIFINEDFDWERDFKFKKKISKISKNVKSICNTHWYIQQLVLALLLLKSKLEIIVAIPVWENQTFIHFLIKKKLKLKWKKKHILNGQGNKMWLQRKSNHQITKYQKERRQENKPPYLRSKSQNPSSSVSNTDRAITFYHMPQSTISDRNEHSNNEIREGNAWRGSGMQVNKRVSGIKRFLPVLWEWRQPNLMQKPESRTQHLRWDVEESQQPVQRKTISQNNNDSDITGEDKCEGLSDLQSLFPQPWNQDLHPNLHVPSPQTARKQLD